MAPQIGLQVDFVPFWDKLTDMSLKTLDVSHLISEFGINLFSGLIIFLIGIYWDQIRSFVKRDLYWLGFILGRKAIQRGVMTITLDTYSDIRLNPELQRALGITLPMNPQRFYKIFPNQHFTWFPGAFESLMGYCSARGSGYLVDAFAHYLRKNGVHVKSDQEVSSLWEETFVNLGSSVSNVKTDDIKNHPKTKWYREDINGRIELKNGQAFLTNDGYDKGMILKIQNPYFKDYSAIICAGLGEWGTSGAAWFLSRNWKELAKRYRGRDFIIIVSVRPGSDESAQEIYADSDLDWLGKLKNRFAGIGQRLKTRK